MVEVYDDRVEIINPGVFPGAKKSDFGKIPVRRNERIADLFFRMDKVERAGTGIRRMKEAMSFAGLPSPRISQTGFYTIIFKRPVERVGEKVGEKVGGRAEEIQRKYGENAEKGLAESWVKKLGERLGERLGENENRILEIVAKNKFVTIPELSKILGISTTAVENNLAKLKAKQFLKRIGPDKGGHWEIVNG